MARSNFAANRVTEEGRLQQRLRFVTDRYNNNNNTRKIGFGVYSYIFQDIGLKISG